MDWKLRLARQKDLAQILDIYKPYILNTTVTFEYEVPSLEEFAERFERVTTQFPWLVCEADGCVVGYAYAERAFERAAYQWGADIAVYIHEDYQRMGIASRFYRCLEEILKLQGYFTLYTAVTGLNEQSIRFHRALGYQEFANFQKSGYKLGTWLDVIWFEKKLAELPANPVPPCPFPLLKKKLLCFIMDKNK